MKPKASDKKTEQKNYGNAHLKYAIRGFNQHLPYYVAVAVAVDVAVAAVHFFLILLS